MKKSLLNFRAFTVALVVLLTSTLVSAQTRTASVSGNWNNTATWGGASVPTSANDVVINNAITVTVTTNEQCNSVTFRSLSGTLSVSASMTLDVVTSITLENTAVATNTAATLSGAGSITCASIVVGGNITAVTGNGLTNVLTSSITSLSVSGNISVNGEDNVNAETLATFSLTTGSLSVGGVITLDSDTDDNDASATFTMNNGASSGTLTLTNATPFSTNGLGAETLAFGSGANATVNYAGGAQTVSPATYRNLIYSGSGAKTGAVTVNDKLSVQGTATVASAVTYSTAILEYKGSSAQTTSTNEFPAAFTGDVIINNAAGVTLDAAKTINGDLTLTSGTLTAGNNLSMSTTGTPVITVDGGSLSGNLQGAADYNVTYTGSSKTTGGELSGSALATVTVSVTAGQTVTLDQDRAPDVNLTITSGILDLSTFTMNRSAAGGTLAISDGATLKIGGTNAFPTNYGTNTIANNTATVDYSGTNQTVSTLAGFESYTILVLSGSGVKTFTGETVNVTLSIQGTATTAGTSPVYGGTAVLEYAGSAAQTTADAEFPLAAGPANVKINNSNGVTLHAARTISGTLNLTLGNLNTASFVLNLADGATTSNASDNSFVNGPLSKTGNDAFIFPVGVAGAGLRTIAISAPGSLTSVFTAEFKRSSAHTLGGITAPITQVSGCEYWTLANTGTASAASVILSWSANSPCNGAYVGNLSTLLVGRLSAGSWVSAGRLSTTGSVTAGTITSAAAIAAANISTSYTLATSAADNALPVMFADVKAYQKNSGVQLEWSNLTERDLTGYTIERSSNGQNFTAIAQQAPRSNRNDKESYTAFDAAPFSGINFYRIKVVEVSGKVIYSKILKVDISGNLGGFSLYPNPVSGSQVSVSLSVKKGQYTVKVVNSAGQQVLSKSLTQQGGSMTQTIDLPSSIKPGLYNMVITGDNYRESKMFVVQ